VVQVTRRFFGAGGRYVMLCAFLVDLVVILEGEAARVLLLLFFFFFFSFFYVRMTPVNKLNLKKPSVDFQGQTRS